MRVSRLIVLVAFVGMSTLHACDDTTSATPVGTVSVKVVDANGAGVQLVNVDLYKVLNTGAVLWRAGRTSSDGMAVFDEGVDAGDYFVHVSFITNYQLATGEVNDKPVTVQGGDNLVVTFSVAPNGPGR